MVRRHVVVTGAGSGIGAATAVHLAELGFEVTALVRDDAERQQLGAAALESGSGGFEVIEGDLADASWRRGLLDGRDVWALVNNAGYMNAGLLRDVPLEDARRQLETMVVAPIDLARQVLPGMMREGQGRIVNVTSSASHAATPLSGWYQACKAALRELTDALRIELRDTGVDVVDIEPGGFRTGIWGAADRELRRLQERSLRPEAYERVLRTMPRAEEKMGDPMDVARAVGEVLTTGQPPAHRRVGPDATPLRLVSDLVPDRLSDWLVARLAPDEHS